MTSNNTFPYVKFHNMMTDSIYDGFLVKSIGDNFYTIDPICYEWLQHTGNWDWLDRLKPRKFEFSFFPYHTVPAPAKGHFIGAFSWLFDFPVKEHQIEYVHSIANFFEWFTSKEEESVYERLALCKSRTHHILPEEIAEDVSAYIRDYFRQNPDKMWTLTKD